MDTTSLQSMIARFLEVQSSDKLILEHLESRRRRRETASRFLQVDRIPALTREELVSLLDDTDAWYGLRWNKEEFWRRVFGENDVRLPTLRETLAELVRRADAGLTATDFNDLLDAMPGIGPAYLSEILALRFPDRYWLWNKQIRDFYESQAIDVKAELPWGKKGDQGEQYLVAGRHLTDLRRALSEATGQPVDYLFADLFVYWANQQERPDQPPDPWVERIEQWQQEYLPPERLRARQEGESRARALLESKLGRFDEADLRQFMADLSADWANDKDRQDRFMPALYGSQVNRMVETLDGFNVWTERIWNASDAELDSLLNEFWERLEVSGAGVSLPTALLYLRDPERYNIWIPVMSEGLRITCGFEPGRMRTAHGYRAYNEASNDFRERYGLSPRALDVILWKVWKDARADKPDQAAVAFPGFTKDTFQFLEELAANNSEEWMSQDDRANKARYRRVLREPLRLLFEAIAPAVAELDPTFETQVKFGKVLAGFRKRFPDEEGAYYTYLWGAFYRQGRTKQTDAQLFVNVHPSYVNAGFSVAGARGSDVLDRFRHNVRQAPDLFLQLLRGLPEGTQVAIAESHGGKSPEMLTIETAEDLQPLFESDLIDIQRHYPSDEPILLEPDFADEVVGLFQALYPLFQFATTDAPEGFVDTAEVEEVEEIDAQVRYALDQLCDDTYLEAGFWKEVEALFDDKKQIVFYGPPGTGKTWVARKFARYWVEAATDPGGDVQVVQFHPSYAYEEFVEGIRPQSVEAAEGHHELSYPVKKGLFRRFCDQARIYPQRRYVLILDEINRGELPRILGELLYLLEYRQETVQLPYSGDLFALPTNLYLIGTMNTADRSIALVDHALRRRFHFVPMRPDPDVLRAYFERRGQLGMVWLADLLDWVNHQLEQDEIEWHLHIGHSHLMRPDLDDTRLRLIWKHSIMPTLEEYFYRQPKRLQAYRLEKLREALGKS